ncbi:MAG: alpha/beta fold hydrolase [Thermoleophilaceae bacterium]|nr:alpha/beta fold hydrolase [Thermoleophilaceae bacterium]
MDRLDIDFTSSGTRCAAWHYEPEGDGKYPYVVMAHGLGGTREGQLAPFAERFAAAGYGVLVFDYRYWGDSDGEPRQLLSVSRQLQDWRAAFDFVRTLPKVDSQRVALWGSSFGGGHAITTAAKVPGVAAAIAQVPFADGLQSLLALRPLTAIRLTFAAIADVALALIGRGPVYVPLLGRPGEVALMSAADSYDGYMSIVPETAITSGNWVNRAAARIALTLPLYSPRRHAKHVTAPLLVLTAAKDTIAPARGAVTAAKNAVAGELKTYDGGHFDYYMGVGFEKIVADEIEFLDRHLKHG